MVDPKVYVGVTASFDAEGRMFPREIIWEDGTIYEIDRILDIRQAAAIKVGGGGDRFTIRVNGKQTFLFFERCAELFVNRENPIIGRWFVIRTSR
ncbi:MAG: hypothetical protein VB064_02375 [Oscillospiraceae bacterium]|nr:hypothetical protein [Oscillospiraceae bacterium]